MRRLTGLIFLLTLVGQSCSETDNQFEKILKSPDMFHGQEIIITGIFHEQFEDNAIYLTETNDKSEAIWVDFSKMFMLLNTFTKLDRQKIKIIGTFDKNDKGHLGQYAGSIKEAKIIIED